MLNLKDAYFLWVFWYQCYIFFRDIERSAAKNALENKIIGK